MSTQYNTLSFRNEDYPVHGCKDAQQVIMLSKTNQGQKEKCTAAPTPSHADSGAIDLAEAEETGSHQGGTEEDGGGSSKEGDVLIG